MISRYLSIWISLEVPLPSARGSDPGTGASHPKQDSKIQGESQRVGQIPSGKINTPALMGTLAGQATDSKELLTRKTSIPEVHELWFTGFLFGCVSKFRGYTVVVLWASFQATSLERVPSKLTSRG